MSAIARLEVIPQTQGSMSDAVARAVQALDEFDVSYETTPTDTIVEADEPTEVFAAAEAAHRAVDGDRVVTSLEIDDLRTRSQRGRERVEAVERRLGRPARRRREEPPSEREQAQQQTEQAGTAGQQQQTDPPRQTEQAQVTGQRQPTSQQSITDRERLQRYGGPWHSTERGSGGQSETEVRQRSRYLQSRGHSPR